MLQSISLRKIFFVFVLAAVVFFATAQSSATGGNSENQQANTSSEQEIRSLAPPDEPPEIIAAKPPATSDPSPPGAKEPLQISYTPCSKAGGDLIFTFSLPMVKKDTLKTAGHPRVSFKPKQKGTFTWCSPTELVFRPSKGFMNGGHDISISIKKAVPLAGEEYVLKDPWRAEFTVPYLKIAGKVANWPIVKGQPRFVSFLNWYTGQIGRGPLFLLYDQPVSAIKVKQLLRLQDNTGKTLEAKVYHPKIGTKQITDSKIDPDYVIAVLITDLSQESSSVDFEIPDWNTPDQPQKLKHTLAVNTSFKLAKSSSNSHYYRNDELVPLKVTWNLVFNNWFETAQLKEVLRMRPEPKSVTVSQSAVSCWSIDWNDENTRCNEREWYSVAHVQLDLDPGTRYRLFTDGWFTDVLGNPLAKPDRKIDHQRQIEFLPPDPS